jgi:hypothetical protein
MEIFRIMFGYIEERLVSADFIWCDKSAVVDGLKHDSRKSY